MESVLRGALDFGAGFREELGAELAAELGAELREEGCVIGWPADTHAASQLAAAYQDIKLRLSSLERENSSIRRKLQHYEIKFPLISVCEERSVCCSCEPKDTKLIQTETSSSLQQRIHSLTLQLQESKTHEESMVEVIKAYEEIHLQKSNVQKQLNTMTSVAEQHVKRIRGLEAALRQRETLLHNKTSRLNNNRDTTQLHSTHLMHLHNSLDVPCVLDCPGQTLQSSRSLDTLTDLKVQRLEAELEGAWHEAQRAWQREAELKTKLQHLQEEIKHLQKNQRQELEAACDHCSVEWIKKAGDEQVSLALAYTELTEELSRISRLTSEQNQILRQRPELRHSPVLQHHCPSSPVCFSSPTCLSSGPACLSPRLSSRCLRARFQGRRSLSETQQVSPRALRSPASTLPKPRPAHLRQQRGAESIGPRPASAHSATRSVTCTSPLRVTRHHPDTPPNPAPLVTPPQSSEDEEDEWPSTSSTHSPPRTLGVTPPHPPFPAPEGPSTLPRPLQDYLNTEHAQSWPSIKLWMECEYRSCPLCQLTFPTGYPDDALITHIDTHLENSKI